MSIFLFAYNPKTSEIVKISHSKLRRKELLVTNLEVTFGIFFSLAQGKKILSQVTAG